MMTIKSIYHKIITISFVLVLFGSCKTKGVDNPHQEDQDTLISSNKSSKETTHQPNELVGVKDSAYRNLNLLTDNATTIKKELLLDDAIKIQWYQLGNGKKLEKNHAYKIEYEVLLDDGTVVDGNKIIHRDWVHFLLGFQLQGKGWDEALSNLKIGDFAKIKIPSKLARGKKGIKGLIPPDANNTLILKIIDEIKPDKEIDGIKIWTLASTPKKEKISDKSSKIVVDYAVSTASNPRFLNTRFTAEPVVVSYQEKGVIQGLKDALIGVKRGDNLWITIPPEKAYGKEGFAEMVKPNESVFYELFVHEVL